MRRRRADGVRSPERWTLGRFHARLYRCLFLIFAYSVFRPRGSVPHQAENESLKESIVGSLGDRGRELVAKCEPADASGTLVTANPKQATKVGLLEGRRCGSR